MSIRNRIIPAVVSVLLHVCTTWTLTKSIKKKFDRNCTRILRVPLNKSWKQHLTKQQLYDHLPLIFKTIPVKRTRHVGYCWRSRDELISDALLWTPSNVHARGCPRGVMVKAMDCGIVVSEFVLQSRYYVHFRANTPGKGIEPPYPSSYGLNSIKTVLLGE